MPRPLPRLQASRMPLNPCSDEGAGRPDEAGTSTARDDGLVQVDEVDVGEPPRDRSNVEVVQRPGPRRRGEWACDGGEHARHRRASRGARPPLRRRREPGDARDDGVDSLTQDPLIRIHEGEYGGSTHPRANLCRLLSRGQGGRRDRASCKLLRTDRAMFLPRPNGPRGGEAAVPADDLVRALPPRRSACAGRRSTPGFTRSASCRAAPRSRPALPGHL